MTLQQRFEVRCDVRSRAAFCRQSFSAATSRGARDGAEALGWQLLKDGSHICPGCSMAMQPPARSFEPVRERAPRVAALQPQPLQERPFTLSPRFRLG
jgi:hypothetical protein